MKILDNVGCLIELTPDELAAARNWKLVLHGKGKFAPWGAAWQSNFRSAIGENGKIDLFSFLILKIKHQRDGQNRSK